MKSVAANSLVRRWLIVSVAVGALFLIVAVAVLFRFDPSQHAFYPKCLLHSLTGLNCAGCGSFRALHHLLHGEFLLALRCNALLVVALLTSVFIGISWWRGRLLAAAMGKWFFQPATALAWLGLALVFTVLRNLPGATFAWLNP